MENWISWVQSDYFIFSMALPGLVTLTALPFFKIKDIRLFGLLILSFILSYPTALWTADSSGLYFLNAAVFILPIAAFHGWLGSHKAYALSWMNCLLVDMVHARSHPAFPDGIGGAGILDSLFMTPLLTALFTWALIEGRKQGWINQGRPTWLKWAYAAARRG